MASNSPVLPSPLLRSGFMMASSAPHSCRESVGLCIMMCTRQWAANQSFYEKRSNWAERGANGAGSDPVSGQLCANCTNAIAQPNIRRMTGPTAPAALLLPPRMIATIA